MSSTEDLLETLAVDGDRHDPRLVYAAASVKARRMPASTPSDVDSGAALTGSRGGSGLDRWPFDSGPKFRERRAGVRRGDVVDRCDPDAAGPVAAIVG